MLEAMKELIIRPFRELKREKMGREMRRAVFDRPEDKQGWSVVSFISTGLAIMALAFTIIALMAMVTIAVTGGIFAFWWVFAVVGYFLE